MKKKKRGKIVARDIDEILHDMPATHYNESTRLEEVGGPQLPHVPDFKRMEEKWLAKLKKIFGDS